MGLSSHTPVPQIEKSTSHNENLLQPLLQNLEQRYHEWPKHQQTAVKKILNDIIDTPLMALQNPQVVHTKGCPSGIQNRQPTNTTRCNPSGLS
ncbi:10539_t:CDS:2 [Cetraspora pellucida]|uniref:10539_t:CDS:1 n=1 Tax=Cetraspora pellucida TaxID=1433469 RepID=A0A9N9E445_9GLOM|nr:10539_t:CDS:2 [Cetraspora pellucida]